ncbi:MAG: hypothetical protein WC334_04085 [Kiritimatiellales bacterium]|jgi:hypothetical protein
MKTLKSVVFKSSRMMRHREQIVLLFLTVAVFAAQGALPVTGLPYINVTSFKITNSSTTGFTVISDGRTNNVAKNSAANPPNGIYGAIRNNGTVQDDSAAFQRALDILNAAKGGVLFIPDGTYAFMNQVSVTASGWALTIQGESTNGVHIYCDNPDGLFKIQDVTRNAQITIRDLDLIALRANAGTALYVTPVVTRLGVDDARTLIAENITMRHLSSTDFFNKGLVMGVLTPYSGDGLATATNSGCVRSIVTGCSFKAPANAQVYLADCGFDFSECYGPELLDCSVKGAKVGYEMGLSSRLEMGMLNRCNADYCMTGIKIWSRYFWSDNLWEDEKPAPEGYVPDQPPGCAPMFNITDCTIRARDFGLILQGRRLVQVMRNTFTRLTTAPLTDIQLGTVREGSVANNVFLGSSGNRTNIVVTCGLSRAGQAFANSYDLVIGPNTLSDGQSGTTSPMIWVDPRTYDIFRY